MVAISHCLRCIHGISGVGCEVILPVTGSLKSDRALLLFIVGPYDYQASTLTIATTFTDSTLFKSALSYTFTPLRACMS
jgi:hypothetical protein